MPCAVWADVALSVRCPQCTGLTSPLLIPAESRESPREPRESRPSARGPKSTREVREVRVSGVREAGMGFRRGENFETLQIGRAEVESEPRMSRRGGVRAAISGGSSGVCSASTSSSRRTEVRPCEEGFRRGS